jgi:perosamine synthetase
MINNQKLALLGGAKVITRPFEKYNPMGVEEVEAARRVVETGVLSRFIGAESPDFNGGDSVRAFERQWEDYFNVKHAISVNSWTSGLIAAVGAIGIEPGDEIIVSPWTMSATATAILHWNAIPIFADIEATSFCLDPQSIERNITPKTKAIMVVDIFGQSADMDAIMKIARSHGLKVISDTAQAPGATYNNKYAGTLADIGGFSLNYHKHIHTGEGGVIVTDNDELAEKCRLIRNHAEAVVESRPDADLTNMLGYNFRLGEIEAAIGIEQLKKLPMLVQQRQAQAARLDAGLKDLAGLNTPFVGEKSTHAYYVYAMTLDIQKTGVARDRIAEALRAEGVPTVSSRYANIHLLPLYQKKIAYGSSGFPWTAEFTRQDISYAKGICPVAEWLQDEAYLGFGICQHQLSQDDIDLIIEAFQKVWSGLDQLR